MLLAQNLTGAPVTLAGGFASVPANGKINVSSELAGLTGPQYTALEAQRPGVIAYHWTQGFAEFSVGTLTVNAPATDTAAAQAAADAAQVDATQALADASAAQVDATQALSDASAAQGTADAAVPKASVQQGVATLVAGTAAVATANITAASKVVPIRETEGGVIGDLSISAQTPGTPGSFNIDSSNALDTSKVRWLVLG